MPFKKGYKMPEEWKIKISNSLKGKNKGIKLSSEHKAKIIKNLRHDYWLGKKRPPLSEEWKNKIKIKMMGNQYAKGAIRTESFKNNLKLQRGKRNPNWQGGKTNKDKLLRNCIEYKNWREAVFKKDNYTCLWCLKRGVFLNADHIYPVELYPQYIYEVNNGRTLCIDCHKQTKNYLRSVKYDDNYQIEIRDGDFLNIFNMVEMMKKVVKDLCPQYENS